MDNLHDSELSTVEVIRGKGEYFGTRADQNLRTSKPARPHVNSTFTQLWLFLAIRFLSSTVFTSPRRYLPDMVIDLRSSDAC
jgi:hypothetical protein